MIISVLSIEGSLSLKKKKKCKPSETSKWKIH